MSECGGAYAVQGWSSNDGVGPQPAIVHHLGGIIEQSQTVGGVEGVKVMSARKGGWGGMVVQDGRKGEGERTDRQTKRGGTDSRRPTGRYLDRQDIYGASNVKTDRVGWTHKHRRDQRRGGLLFEQSTEKAR